MELINCLLTDERCSDRYKTQRSIWHTHLFLHFNFRNNWANLNTSYVVLENTLKIARRMTKYKITRELNCKADIRPVSGQFATTTDSPPKNSPPLSKWPYILGVPTAVGCVVWPSNWGEPSEGQALLRDVLTTSHVKMKMNSAQDVCRSRDISLVGENWLTCQLFFRNDAVQVSYGLSASKICRR